MSVPVCYYGSPEPLPARRELRAGALTAVYEAGDLRYVRAGGVEVCRRWYAAVRDHNWGTVPGVISDEVIEQTADGFRVRYTSSHRRGDIHFVWHADIEGTAAGIRFLFDGEAKTTFRRNRIGFCVLHPPDTCAGRAVELFHPDGSMEQADFPDLIVPQNPFRELVGLRHGLPGGGSVGWHFDGDIFETEDQRNWIDASFKTFCTPLRLPFPVEVRAGDRVRQIVTLAIHGATAVEPRAIGMSLTPDTGPVKRLPRIGLGVGTHPDLDPTERDLLRRLGPAHLRADIDLTDTDGRWVHRLADAWQTCLDLGTALELGVSVSDAADAEAAELAAVVRRFDLPLARLLLFHHREWGTPERVVGPVGDTLAAAGIRVPLCVGTRANFTELNRGRPPDPADGVCYSVQPQEHAFDNASLVECCAAIAATVRSARAFAAGKPIHVGPITLRKRVNPYATGPAPPVLSDELPPTVDPRQMSLFGAGWTLAALKYLAESGVESVALYETTGWLGVVEWASGCRLPHLFPSRPGMTFPLYHVLADTNEFAGAEVMPVRSSDPLAFDGLMLRRDGITRLMLANLTGERRVVTVRDLPGEVVVRTLDETTFEEATRDPLAFRERYGEPFLTRDGEATIALNPYAYVRCEYV